MTPNSHHRTGRKNTRMAIATTVMLAASAFGLRAEAAASARDGEQPTEIRIARSADGMSFDALDIPLARSATSPSLTKLPNGSLLALYSDASNSSPRLMQTISHDDGQTWSAAIPVQIEGLRGGETPISGTLAMLPNRIGRLFFLTQPAGIDDDSKAPTGKLLRSAITRDGRTFRLERGARAFARGYPRRALTRVDVAPAGGRLQLFVTEIDQRNKQHARTRRILLLGRYRSVELSPAMIDAQTRLGSVLEIPGGLRAFANQDDDIVSYRSRDGRRWIREPRTRLQSAHDPAAIQLGGTNHLMLAVTESIADSASATTLVESGRPYAASGSWIEDDTWNQTADSFALLSPDAELDDGVLLDEDGNIVTAEVEGFPPALDLDNPVNYFEWYKNEALPHPKENAYDTYATFIPGMIPGQEDDELAWTDEMWAGLGEDFDPATGPWSDDRNPERAQFSDEVQDLLRKFEDATKIQGYASPAITSEESGTLSPDEPLLIGILLPNLRAFRSLTKATLRDAWRERDGKVDPDRMVRSVETVIRMSKQLESGATLIEELVGLAGQNLARRSAIEALHQNVLGSEHRNRMLDALRTLDTPMADPLQSLRGEYGFAMQTTKLAFKKGADGELSVNWEGLDPLIESGVLPDESDAPLADLTPEDAEPTIDAVDTYYRELGAMMRTGYPEIRRADVNALHQEYTGASPLTEYMLPQLGRVHALRARYEAVRRAAQLSYEVHAFRDRHHRWPVSLDEVQTGGSTDVRIDPFSGDYFGYQLTPDGPRIYSLSENGIDDGGVHAQRWDDAPDPLTGSDDHVFYPPQPQ